MTRQFVKVGTLMSAWGRLLRGYSPLLSIEITRECPLQCPGCYAYDDNHLGGAVTLRQLRDLKGDDLVDGVLDLVRRHRPVQVSFVGGEPLIRHRELSRILPVVSEMGNLLARGDERSDAVSPGVERDPRRPGRGVD